MAKQQKIIGVGGFETSPKAREYVNQVLTDGRLSYGRWHQRFEQQFAELHDCRFAAFCNSGTSALQVALAAMKELHGLRDGDEVILPATTFVATYNVILYNNLTPVLVDVDPTTYLIDPEKIAAAITPRTKAILPVHLFGMPCDMDPILHVADTHGLRILEDSCETMFSRYRGRRVGSFGDAGCFSTYIAHILVTGVGGLVTTNDQDLYILVRSLLNHGRDSIYLSIDDSKTDQPQIHKEVIGKRFSFVRPGFSYRATELEAALGVAQLEDHAALIRRRQENAAYITEALAPWSDHLQLPSVPANREHVFMMYPIVIKPQSRVAKQALVEYLETEEGIETRDMLPLVNQPVYRDRIPDPKQYPVSKWIVDNGFYIGSHPYLTQEDLRRIRDGFARAFDTLL